ncbi:MAG: DUF1616 domain-containing protein [Haloferacaceae archaeon]
MRFSETRTTWRNAVGTIAKQLPAHLLAVGGFGVAVPVVLLALPLPVPVRAALGLPLILFVPGYLLVAATYPGRYRPSGSGTQFTTVSRSGSGVRPVERLVLSFGMSLALAPMFALVLWSVQGSIDRGPALVGLGVLALAETVVAAVRHVRLPSGERFDLPAGRLSAAVRSFVDGRSRRGLTLGGVLVASVLIATAVMGAGLLVPTDAQTYTSAALLTERDGELVAGDYPAEFTAGEAEPLTLRVTNNEGGEVAYTVVVAAERVDRSGDAATVTDRTVLRRESERLAGGETWTWEHEVAPELTGEDVRISYYLYRGEAPERPSASSAYRHLHFGTSVSDG